MIPKQSNLVSNAIRKSAKGEDCTLNIAGVCNYDNSTTVLCHFPSETSGKGKKSTDFSAGYGCCRCHDVIDGRVKYSGNDLDFYMRRSQTRTLHRLMEKGLVTVKGLK